MALESESSFEKIANAVDIAIEIILGIDMFRGDHLRKIYEYGFPFAGHHDVKFIEVTVNDAVITKSDDEIHELVVENFNVVYFVYAAERSAFYEFHDHAVSVEVYRHGHRETSFVQRFHVCEFTGRRYPGEIQPRHGFSTLMVISFFLDIAKTRSAQSMQLQTHRISIRVTHDVNI